MQGVRAGEESEGARVEQEEQEVLAVAQADGRAEPGKRAVGGNGRAAAGQ